MLTIGDHQRAPNRVGDTLPAFAPVVGLVPMPPSRKCISLEPLPGIRVRIDRVPIQGTHLRQTIAESEALSIWPRRRYVIGDGSFYQDQSLGWLFPIRDATRYVI